ncbi:hypothetical protein [Ruania alba]|uniref:Uncharacterized protein n=1 Tax=Ruania alba TaxID=648782 RepID=A0A1H5NGD1_9MICO|nr:hypothetical protein [Ruania alba]SEF00596.1 hypothetical protein SAMN04488554_4309 [Ruania alba]
MSAPPPSGPDPYRQVHDDTQATAARPRPELANPNVGGVVLLLVLASIGYLVWHVIEWTGPFVSSMEACAEAGETITCLTGEEPRKWFYLPIAAVISAWSLAAGARVEGKQGRSRGFLLALAGFTVLGVSAWVSAS